MINFKNNVKIKIINIFVQLHKHYNKFYYGIFSNFPKTIIPIILLIKFTENFYKNGLS